MPACHHCQICTRKHRWKHKAHALDINDWCLVWGTFQTGIVALRNSAEATVTDEEKPVYVTEHETTN